jgi:hypothetical protein
MDETWVSCRKFDEYFTDIYWSVVSTLFWLSFSDSFEIITVFETIIMSRFVHDSTTHFQGRSFSSHKPYILDPGGSATIAVQKLGVPDPKLQDPKNLFLFNDSTFSLVWSGLPKTEVLSTRPQGSLEENYLNSEIKPKLAKEKEGFKVIIDIFQEKCKKHTRNQDKTKFCSNFRIPKYQR